MLYLVPTPIGNLGDISPRALDCLEEADFIAVEDTRVTIKLLNHFEIKKQMIAYHRHNMEESGRKIVERMINGEVCALVSDAGTPAISDPGEDLVRLCVENQIPVVGIPGASAVTTALSVCGLDTTRFTFEGFLPMNKKNRKQHLEEIRYETRTMVFYEAPHKLQQTLGDFSNILGEDRPLVICRELTKKHEEILRLTLKEAVSHFETVAPRGEFVLVLSGGEKKEVETPTLEDGLEEVLSYVEEGISLRDACKQVAEKWDLSKNQLYKLANREKDE